MSENNSNDQVNINQQLSQILTDVLIRFGLIAAIVVLCIEVFSPFLALMMWALILAVALYPAHLKLVEKTGGRQGLSATIIVLLGLALIGSPTIMLGRSFSTHLLEIYGQFQAGTLTIPVPDQAVAQIPLIGEDIYQFWQSAYQDLPHLLKSVGPQLQEFSRVLMGIAASTAGAVVSFLGALLVAGIMMAYGSPGSKAMLEICQRFSTPQKGLKIQKLSVGTIRSVASGVIGVAFIQSLLFGIGFVLANYPGAGILAVIVMVIGILQLPAAIVSIPAIAFLWVSGDASTTMNIIFSVYFFMAGLADNILKPLLLGRGVDAPMPVVLLGAIGGMVVAGIIGLFVGAVVLTVGYQIFMDWIKAPPVINTP